MTHASMRRQWPYHEVDAQRHQIMASIHERCVEYGKSGDHVD